MRPIVSEKHAQFVRFERGRDDVTGPTFGPYEYVQITYETVTAQPLDEGMPLLTELAFLMKGKGDDWELGDDAGEHRGEVYSDVILFSAPARDALKDDEKRDGSGAVTTNAHNCAKAKKREAR